MVTPTTTRNANANDREWMAVALELAAQGEALTSPNPQVGCVIVKDGAEVGRGFHTYDGITHAEALALEQAGEHARGATLYTNLEPCSHTGRTPPCAEAILRAGIVRVVVCMTDPNPSVNGAGLEALRGNGIAVETNLLEDEARRLNEAYAFRIKQGRPMVTLKSGLSLDGRIALDHRSTTWLTSEESRAEVQRLRHQSDALITGIGTVLADDPRMTDRTESPRRRPLLRVVLDAGLRIPLDSKLVQEADNDLLMVTGEDVWQGKRKQLAEKTVETIEVKESGGRISLPAVLQQLAARDINSVILEAGARLNAHAVELNCVDKVWLFYAPRFLGGDAVPLLDGNVQLPELTDIRQHRFGPDLAVEGYVREDT